MLPVQYYIMLPSFGSNHHRLLCRHQTHSIGLWSQKYSPLSSDSSSFRQAYYTLTPLSQRKILPISNTMWYLRTRVTKGSRSGYSDALGSNNSLFLWLPSLLWVTLKQSKADQLHKGVNVFVRKTGPGDRCRAALAFRMARP